MLSRPNAANEDYNVDDLLDFSSFVKELKGIADNSPRRAIVGIVGPYGSGKSVMLTAFRNKYAASTDNAVWIHFDAWKYPDRSKLWEAFVIDFVWQYKEKMFKSVLKIIDGTIFNFPKSVISATLKSLPKGTGKEAAKLFGALTPSSPVKRIFEIQSLFKELFYERHEIEKRRIYVVIEDADRSGQAGLYFIETLSQFLKNFSEDIEMKVFVPIAPESYEPRNSEDWISHNSYIKTLDAVQLFQFRSRDMRMFVKTVFNKELLAYSNYEHYITELLQRLLYNQQLTLRDIKFIIRNAEIKYAKLEAQGLRPDPIVVLVLEAARHYRYSADEEVSAHIRMVRDKRILRTQDVGIILIAMGLGNTVQEVAAIMSSSPTSTPYSIDIQFSDTYEDKNDKFASPSQRYNRIELPLFYIAGEEY